MLYILCATSALPVGAPMRVVFNVAGDKQAAINFIRTQRIGELPITLKGVRYKVELIGSNDCADNMILCVQPQFPQVDASQAVQAAQYSPQGQQGQQRPSGELDAMGFQVLGDEALPVSGDGDVFGDERDSTVSDLIIDGGAPREIPRNRA